MNGLVSGYGSDSDDEDNGTESAAKNGQNSEDVSNIEGNQRLIIYLRICVVFFLTTLLDKSA